MADGDLCGVHTKYAFVSAPTEYGIPVFRYQAYDETAIFPIKVMGYTYRLPAINLPILQYTDEAFCYAVCTATKMFFFCGLREIVSRVTIPIPTYRVHVVHIPVPIVLGPGN